MDGNCVYPIMINGSDDLLLAAEASLQSADFTDVWSFVFCKSFACLRRNEDGEGLRDVQSTYVSHNNSCRYLSKLTTM